MAGTRNSLDNDQQPVNTSNSLLQCTRVHIFYDQIKQLKKTLLDGQQRALLQKSSNVLICQTEPNLE